MAEDPWYSIWKGLRKLNGCQWLSHCHQIAIKSTTQRLTLECFVVLQNSLDNSTAQLEQIWSSASRLEWSPHMLNNSGTQAAALPYVAIGPLALAEWCAFLG